MLVQFPLFMSVCAYSGTAGPAKSRVCKVRCQIQIHVWEYTDLKICTSVHIKVNRLYIINRYFEVILI